MFFKQIQSLLTVAVRYFFNLDLHLFTPALLSIIVVIGFIKLFMSKVVDELHWGLLTVKEDAINLADSIKESWDRWQNSETHDLLISYTRSIKSHLSRQ